MTAGELLARVLAVAGVGAAYGRPLPGVPVTEIADPDVAVLLAHAHRAVHGVPAVAHLGEGTLIVPGPSPRGGPDPQTPAEVVDAPDVEALRSLAPALARAQRGAGVCVAVTTDPAAPVERSLVAVPSAEPAWAEPDEALLGELARAERVVVLAGPAVVERRAVGALRALAAVGRLGVLNTWGAKGVFDWQSRHHWATVGLQARDFELGGVLEADLVLATGVDEREAPRPLWAAAGHAVREVAPEALGALAERWPVAPREFPDMPPLRQRLAAVTQAGWAASGTPLVPSLVTRHYAQVLGEAGLVAADPGTAGFWVARTFATTRLRSVLVPAAPVEGWAPACALVSRLTAPLRPVLAVADGPLGARSQAVLREAARLGVGLGIEVWQEGGQALDADAHLERLGDLAGAEPAGRGGAVATLATDGRQLDEMVDAAGPVRAWTG